MSRQNSILVSRTFYQIGVATFISSIIWAIVGFYNASKQTADIEVDPILLNPIVLDIDQQTMTKLSNRLKVEDVIVETEASSNELIK